ncbi:type VII secretion target [Kitasatospora sp. NPDC050543]|uniref:type VII secretion target n=1 Tax=Kitasatospora sp. NPDC050543 TaxID=3364054 RepID=UPI00379A082D
MNDNQGGGGQFAVDPAVLDAAGRSAQKTAPQIPEASKGVLGPSDQAEAGLKGFQSAATLNACTDAWKAALDSITTEMDKCGENLIKTAETYRGGDDKALQSMSAPATALSGGGGSTSIASVRAAGAGGAAGGGAPVGPSTTVQSATDPGSSMLTDLLGHTIGVGGDQGSTRPTPGQRPPAIGKPNGPENVWIGPYPAERPFPAPPSKNVNPFEPPNITYPIGEVNPIHWVDPEGGSNRPFITGPVPRHPAPNPDPFFDNGFFDNGMDEAHHPIKGDDLPLVEHQFEPPTKEDRERMDRIIRGEGPKAAGL